MSSQKLVVIFIFLALFFLWVLSGAQGQNLNIVSANNILENISKGKDIELYDSVIIGELDFNKLNKTNLKFIPKYTILNPECFIENEPIEEKM